MRHGFLLIDKPSGPTSHDVVQMIRKQLHERSAGHIGTLDPLASGLLVIAIGKKALKVIEFFSGLDKEYVADIRLGAVSTTYDADGIIEDVKTKPGWAEPDELRIRQIIEQRFSGKISQVPPAHSAVHVQGKRAYERARAGEEVKIDPRIVSIDECEILSYEYPHVKLRVRCGSGTYIRSLAHDLGSALRCGGYLSALRRTKVGEWKVEDGVIPERVQWTDVLPLKAVLKDLPSIELTDAQWENVQHGRTIDVHMDEETFGWHGGLPVAVLAAKGKGIAGPRKVL